jgi:hypothetical protein
VYTALLGQYEQLNEQPVAASTDIEFVCFTDDPELTSDSWDVRLVSPRFPSDIVRSARFIKVIGPELLADYDESLWIDNTVVLRQRPDELLDAWLHDRDIAVPSHGYRSSVLGEFDAVVAAGYDEPSRVYEQLIHYSTLGHEALREPPYWTALLARRRSSEIDRTMHLWWDHLLRYSRRDQLSFNFVCAQTELPVNRVDIDNFNSEWHEWPVRAARKWNVTQDRMEDALRIPTAEIGRLENALTQTRAELEKLIAERELAALHAEQAQRDAEQAKRDAERARALSEGYARSRSWRITAPLRAIAKLRATR